MGVYCPLTHTVSICLERKISEKSMMDEHWRLLLLLSEISGHMDWQEVEVRVMGTPENSTQLAEYQQTGSVPF